MRAEMIQSGDRYNAASISKVLLQIKLIALVSLWSTNTVLDTRLQKAILGISKKPDILATDLSQI